MFNCIAFAVRILCFLDPVNKALSICLPGSDYMNSFFVSAANNIARPHSSSPKSDRVRPQSEWFWPPIRSVACKSSVPEMQGWKFTIINVAIWQMWHPDLPGQPCELCSFVHKDQPHAVHSTLSLSSQSSSEVQATSKCHQQIGSVNWMYNILDCPPETHLVDISSDQQSQGWGWHLTVHWDFSANVGMHNNERDEPFDPKQHWLWNNPRYLLEQIFRLGTTQNQQMKCSRQSLQTWMAKWSCAAKFEPLMKCSKLVGWLKISSINEHQTSSLCNPFSRRFCTYTSTVVVHEVWWCVVAHAGTMRVL